MKYSAHQAKSRMKAIQETRGEREEKRREERGEEYNFSYFPLRALTCIGPSSRVQTKKAWFLLSQILIFRWPSYTFDCTMHTPQQQMHTHMIQVACSFSFYFILLHVNSLSLFPLVALAVVTLRTMMDTSAAVKPDALTVLSRWHEIGETDRREEMKVHSDAHAGREKKKDKCSLSQDKLGGAAADG